VLIVVAPIGKFPGEYFSLALFNELYQTSILGLFTKKTLFYYIKSFFWFKKFNICSGVRWLRQPLQTLGLYECFKISVFKFFFRVNFVQIMTISSFSLSSISDKGTQALTVLQSQYKPQIIH
jgi:hypothetical protein